MLVGQADALQCTLGHGSRAACCFPPLLAWLGCAAQLQAQLRATANACTPTPPHTPCLHGGAILAQAIQPSVEVSREGSRATCQLAQAEGVSIDQHRLCPQLAAISCLDAAGRTVLNYDPAGGQASSGREMSGGGQVETEYAGCAGMQGRSCLLAPCQKWATRGPPAQLPAHLSTGRPVCILAPARMAAAARRWVTAPMPPATTIHVPSAPGSRHMLCTSRLCPLPAVSHPPFSPLKPSVVCASKGQAGMAGAVVALQQHMQPAFASSGPRAAARQAPSAASACIENRGQQLAHRIHGL